MNSKPSVLIVEDHRLLKIGLQASLENSGCCTIVGDADDGESAVRQTLKLHPDIILMDIGLPGMDGIEATWRIKLELPRTRIIMFTARAEADAVSAAFGAGADGYCGRQFKSQKYSERLRLWSGRRPPTFFGYGICGRHKHGRNYCREERI